MKYRYRCKLGTTRAATARFDRVLAKLGHILYVRGYRYPNKYGTTDERVLVRGVNGTARFDGLLWGYGGEGPHGTRDLLAKLGLTKEQAGDVAFRSERRKEVGEDWRVSFTPTVTKPGQTMNHPLKVGDRILSVYGEQDEGDDGERQTGPNAVGEVISVDHYDNAQGWTYGVTFPNGTWVYLDQYKADRPNIDDETAYRKVS